jgi:uncharacterized protein (DUF1697 family)
MNWADPMKTYVALIRGINVGGSRMLPMKDLKLLFERHGCLDVQTYIQSGNVVFRRAASDAPRLAKLVAAAVSKERGFEPRVLVLTRGELERAAANNPFPQAEASPQSVHLFFLAEPAKNADLKAMEALRASTERFTLKGNVLYLHTPDGFGISKLAARTERLLGVEATARNWRTVTTLLDMAKM